MGKTVSVQSFQIPANGIEYKPKSIGNFIRFDTIGTSTIRVVPIEIQKMFLAGVLTATEYNDLCQRTFNVYQWREHFLNNTSPPTITSIAVFHISYNLAEFPYESFFIYATNLQPIKVLITETIETRDYVVL